MDNLLSTFQETFYLTLNYFNSPNKRIYYLYIISSFFIALVVFYSKKRKSSLFEYFFSKKIWLSQSAFVDYSLLFFNSLIKLVFIAPLLIFSLKIAFYTNEFLLDRFNYPSFSISKKLMMVIYTITVFIMVDLFSYLVHFLQHKVPFLWRFHKVHHSATTLNPFTQYRIHPIELIMNNLKAIVVNGLLIGVFDFLAGGRISVYLFLSVNVFNFFFLFLGANLRHSHVELCYSKFFENIFISPFQHQIHHSDNKEHFDKNLGSKLAICDLLFGTLVKSKEVSKINFGIGKEGHEYDTFLKSLISPFIFWK
jgi:sterol desaturase/sphingolipid hydroxylase (fatty acid hydroxylase superfamily)